MEKRRSKSSNRIVLQVAAGVCVVGFIASVAYTRADRTAILLSTTTTDLRLPVADRRFEIENQAAIEDATRRVALPSSEARGTSDEGRGTSEPVSEWRTVRMRVTAYCPCPKCCGQYSDGITANGYRIQPGDTFVAADRRYAFGTEMIVPGYNNGQPVKVLDRGGAIRGDKLDAFFPTHQAALEWGVKYLDVQVRDK